MLHDALDDGLAENGQHRLGAVGGDGVEAGAFTGGEDDSLHIQLTAKARRAQSFDISAMGLFDYFLPVNRR